MPSVSPPGPRAEKYATTGAGLYPVTSTVGRMVATGFLIIKSGNCIEQLKIIAENISMVLSTYLVELMYFSI